MVDQNGGDHGAVKMPIKVGMEKKAIHCSRRSGPTFGAEKDLTLLDSGQSKVRTASAAASRLGDDIGLLRPGGRRAPTYSRHPFIWPIR